MMAISGVLDQETSVSLMVAGEDAYSELEAFSEKKKRKPLREHHEKPGV